jgi:perosamine synthetase
MQRISDKERAYVLQVLEGQYRTSAGHQMNARLEQAFATKFNAQYAISHTNGTASLHTALVAAGVRPGDEVIVPPLTMSSTTFAVLQANATPVFADVDHNTFTIDPADICRKVSERTKAIIPVALYGLSADMDPIMEIAREHNLTVIEDDAECFLGQYKGRAIGSIGHFGSFSFQSSKHMTSGEGGMLITNDRELAERARRFNSLGYAGVGAGKGKITRDELQNPAYERHVSLGWNYRMPELCAAVALAQLERLDELVNQRRAIARLYDHAIEGCEWLKPQSVPNGYVHTYWTYPLALDIGKVEWTTFRKKYMELGGDGMYAAWKLAYHEPFFCNPTTFTYPEQGKYGVMGCCPIAEALQPRILQFKTNYMDLDLAAQKAEALAKTIAFFDGHA